MIYKYTLKGEVPAKKNSRITTREGRNYPSKQYLLWHEEAAVQIAIQGRVIKPLSKCKSLTVTFYHTTNARRDTDNQAASIKDLLVDCGILEDDRWQVVGEEHYIPVMEKGGEARCVIVIESEMQCGGE